MVVITKLFLVRGEGEAAVGGRIRLGVHQI